MTDLNGFLKRHAWDEAHQTALAGDASTRAYTRLQCGTATAIAMVDPGQTTARFAQVARFLTDAGLSAPAIFAHEPGLMILEDLGDNLFARIIAQDPHREQPLYQAAVDALVHLHRQEPPEYLERTTPGYLAGLIDPVFSFYLPAFGIQDHAIAASIRDHLLSLLEQHAGAPNVTILRDFHAENLIWLPARTGIARVGLLDFQDALIGHDAYDLVSLLQDARRDVSKATAEAAIRRYLDMTGGEETPFLNMFHTLGIQRNLRILGIFARLATQQAKPQYLSLIPRVWGHVRTSLDWLHPHPVSRLITEHFPDPTPSQLQELRSACPMP